jgi:Flp pilus assembly protein TadG
MSGPPTRACDGRPGQERGTASLEIVALVPIILLVGTMMLQLGVAVWTTVAADTAARQVARAVALGGDDPQGVANRSLPGSLTARPFTPDIGADEVRVTLSVDIPRVSLLPQFTVRRDAVMPKSAP